MRRLGLFGAVVLALVLVYVIAWRTQPASHVVARVTGENATVTSVTRSCPPALGSGDRQITMVAVPSTASGKTATATPTGAATLSTLAAAPATPAAKAAKPVSVTSPGTVTTVTVPSAAASGGVAVSATGQLAEGFEAEQANSSGMGLVSCTHPSSDMWFVGTGTGAGATSVWLYLMNTGDVASSVDVTILTDTGQQSGLSNAITVNPGQSVAENVTPYITGSQALALHIQTASGQVAASVWEGGDGGGAWLPQAAAPSTSLVIPGLTVASSPAHLFVVVPGSGDARLSMVAFTPSGAVPEFTGAPIEASAGAATPVSLNTLSASATGIKLTSNVPVVAGVLVPGSGLGSFTTATSPISGQGVVAGNPATRGVTVGLLLTAPSGTAEATIRVIGAAGTAPGSGQLVTVPTGRTVAVTVPPPPGSRQPFAIVITPRAGSAPLYAVRVVTAGTGGLTAPLASLLPVPSAPTSIALPPVANSYTAVLP